MPPLSTTVPLAPHLWALGAQAVDNHDADGFVIVDFPTIEALQQAVARPETWGDDSAAVLQAVLGDSEAERAAMAANGAAPLPRLRTMLRVLQAVGLQHLVLRERDGWLAERVWEDTLSGGEQQRLALARIFYHQPTFGLLDECTSMVAADAEEELYRRLIHEWGVTPVVLTQRLFLPRLFGRELTLGAQSLDGWDYKSAAEEDALAGGGTA